MLKKRYIFLFLAITLCALAVLSWDFSCGHMDESPFAPNTCPLCAAFSSFAPFFIFLGILFLFYTLSLFGLILSGRLGEILPPCLYLVCPRPPPAL